MNTPNPDGPPTKKKKKKANKLLSFGEDEEEEGDGPLLSKPSNHKTALLVPGVQVTTRKSNPNAALPAPKAMTKVAQALETVERERLRKEFLEMQEKVKSTDIAVPFVFYDGGNTPGGTVKVKKGDKVWVILERARKIGAEQGVQGSNSVSVGAASKSRAESQKQWARVGLDDLILLRGDTIIPHHYEIYYFIANKTPDPSRAGKPLFGYFDTVPTRPDDEQTPLLRVPGKEKLEGHDDDDDYTKVVDRRWYEKNKHIFPASTWKEFKVGKEHDGQAKGRTDAEGNSFFYS